MSWRSSLAILSLAGPTILICVFLLSFVFVEFSELRPRFDFGLDELRTLGVPETWLSLRRSALLAAVAGCLSFVIIESICARLEWGDAKRPAASDRRLVARRTAWLGLLALPYLVDPVSRVLASRHLFGWIDKVLEGFSHELDGKPFTFYVAPVFVLTLNYAPAYLFLRLMGFHSDSRAAWIPARGLNRWLFVTTPAMLDRMPFAVAFIFFLTLFDPWVLTVIGGNKVNYWGPLVVDRARSSRDVEVALVMCLVGFVVVIGVWAMLRCGRTLTLAALQRVTPVSQTVPVWAPSPKRDLRRYLAAPIYSVVFAVMGWPILWLVFRALTGPPDATTHDVLLLALNTGAVVLPVVVLSLVLGGVQWGVHAAGYWCTGLFMPCWLFLALVPEAAYIVCVVFLTGSGVVSLGRPLFVALFVSFCAPISALAYSRYFEGVRAAKADLVSAAWARAPVVTVRIVTRQFTPLLVGVGLFVTWLTLDNVLLASYSLWPGQETATMWMFANSTRGITANDAARALGLAALRLIIITVALVAYQLGTRRYERMES